MFMSKRMAAAGVRLAARPSASPALQAFCFSAEGGEAKPAEQPAAAEPDSTSGEWGIKYDDECLKFEKEWKEIAEKV